MPPMRRTRMAAAAVSAMLLAGGTLAGGVVPTPAGATENVAPAAMWYYLQAEDQILAVTNQVRAAVGVGGLTRHPALDEYARLHALQMAQTGQLVHSDIGRLLGPFSSVAENISMGPSVESICSGLQASPPHYANMTNPSMPYVGVGVVWADGVLWTAHVFASA